ncbi:efflux RND transporter permease subunit [Bauldia sp.]|uniref:efflux RND transporter permease subunit n=1 Tax=Bauldia sp. TaxID=2575872 RepID=UPI003BAC5E36
MIGAGKTADGVSALFVRRPVLAIVLNLLIIVAGVAALQGVEVRELPNVDRPVISIRTNYSGATPETIDKEITAVVEGAVARTPGVETISARSSAGSSRITIEFSETTDLNVAANDLRDVIGGLRSLPDDADAPVIVKADTDSDAIMRLSATSEDRPIDELTRLVNDLVVDRLAAVEGVADVSVYGDREPVVRVIVDPDALAARGLTVDDVIATLRDIALDAPAGRVSDATQTLLVRADASAKSVEEISAVEINPTTRIGDIADVVFSRAEQATTMRMNGASGVGMGIVRQADSNTLEISSAVRAAVDELQASLPDDVTLTVTSDDAIFISGAIGEVIFTLGLAILIVVAVIYVFLRSVRITFIPAITLPIALIGTVGAIYLAGFSINILTLLALVLATGMVVDDAIVVVENIARQRHLGLGPRAAAVIGTRQVFFAVISTTVTLAAVFIPISFFPGTAGRLFSEFGFVLAFAVLLSSIVALTLCPMLASRWIGTSAPGTATPIGRAVSAVGRGAERVYARLLRAALDAPIVVLTIAGVFAAAAVIAFATLPSQLTPTEDRGFIPISVRAPQGATVDYTAAQIRMAEDALQPFIDSGEAETVFATARGFGGGGFMFVRLAPWEERARSQQEITADINQRLGQIPGIQVFARTPNSLGIRGGGQGLRFAVAGPDYDAIAIAADELEDAMTGDPTFGNIRLDYDTTQPQVSIVIDRERAADLGIPVGDIASVVQTLLDGRDLGNFYVGDDAIEIRLQAPEGMIQDPSGLDRIELRSSSGRMVPLASLVTFEETAVAPNLQRQDQRRAVPMTAGLGDDVDLRQAMDRLSEIAEATLPPGMTILYSGEARELDRASSGVLQTFIFALIIVFLVLAAQFESFVSALILIATVPFGLAAAVFAILVTGGSLNIYSQIGLVLLVGLMAKNGILIVEFANQLRDQGQSVRDAIFDAAVIRLRPVVMTMISTVLSGLPLLLTTGAGSEARRALGTIIVGGLGIATLATLFLTPVVFSLLARLTKPRIAETQRLERELAAAEGTPLGLTPTPEELGQRPKGVSAAE